LFVVLGSGVELETWAVFVIQPLPLLLMGVVIVNDAVPLAASDPTSQRTVRVAFVYVHPGAEPKDTREGNVSVTTTPCAEPGPRLLTCSVHTAVEPPLDPVFARARSALCGGGTGSYVAVYVVEVFATTLWLCAPPSDHDDQA
jgi:hypothetical protein